jgi:hypothetical protein
VLATGSQFAIELFSVLNFFLSLPKGQDSNFRQEVLKIMYFQSVNTYF